jgi:hypothetical protein
MAKVSAVACDLPSCESVAKADENGLPVNWFQAQISQGGRKLVSETVFCSSACLVTYLRDVDDVTPRRRRRTKAQIEADNETERLAAELNGDVPVSGTDAQLASNAPA